MMVMSQGAMSAGLTGLPRLGPSAAIAVADSMAVASATGRAKLCVDMVHIPLPGHGPARNRVEMLAREIQHGRRFRGLSAQRHELRSCRLHRAALVESAAL